MKLRNTHTNSIQDYPKLSNMDRADVYFNAAYKRIFKQKIKGCCEAISFSDPNKIYQVFTLSNNRVRKYKKVYAELYPEFMLFEQQYTSNGYWFGLNDEGNNERILALLLCHEIAKSA